MHQIHSTLPSTEALQVQQKDGYKSDVSAGGGWSGYGLAAGNQLFNNPTNTLTILLSEHYFLIWKLMCSFEDTHQFGCFLHPDYIHYSRGP